MNVLATEPPEFPLLSSTFAAPGLRERLHTICALYAHTPAHERRKELLDTLETLTLETAHLLAVDLLEHGWTPDS